MHSCEFLLLMHSCEFLLLMHSCEFLLLMHSCEFLLLMHRERVFEIAGVCLGAAHATEKKMQEVRVISSSNHIDPLSGVCPLPMQDRQGKGTQEGVIEWPCNVAKQNHNAQKHALKSSKSSIKM